jgi:hypothetical protein
MEKSPHFHAPQVESESVLGEGAAGPASGNIQFEIAAVYVPFADDSEPSDQAKPEQKPAGKSAPKTSSSGSSTSTGGGH